LRKTVAQSRLHSSCLAFTLALVLIYLAISIPPKAPHRLPFRLYQGARSVRPSMLLNRALTTGLSQTEH
jgi:hypothetical protein